VSGIYEELNMDMMQNINNKIIEKSRIKKMQDANANQFSTMQVASANLSIQSPKLHNYSPQNTHTPLSP